jgi:Sulfotransferase family
MSEGTERDIVFVGGTGRSGTHIVADLLGRHSRFAAIPIECRFHCNPNGLADLVTGETTPAEFLAKLRGFWWHRVRVGDRTIVRPGRLSLLRRSNGEARVRGLHKLMPRDRFERAVARFEGDHERDLVAASRALFLDLLWPFAVEHGKPELVEMSCFTIAAAPGLARILPEARFVHMVRDGRDSGSSKVSLRHKPHHPTDVETGIEWWQGRMALAEQGVRGLPDAPSRVRAISLDELVWGDREPAYGELLGFLGIDDEGPMREFFEREMSADAAHRDRWRRGLDREEQAAIEARYAAAIERMEREGYHCAPLLRRSYERTVAGV